MSQLLILAICLCIGFLAGIWFNYLALVPATLALLAISCLFSESIGEATFWLCACVNILALQGAYLVSALALRPWIQKHVPASERAKTADVAQRAICQNVESLEASSASQACATDSNAAPDRFAWLATALKKSGVQP